MLNIQSIKLADGNVVECPRMNDSVRLEKACGPYRTARQCIEQCKFSETKTNLLSTFAGLQFICIDRIDDWKGYMPCLSEHCVEIQGACAPKCGSFNYIIKQVVALLQEANDRRFAQRDASKNSTALDVDRFSKVFADSCSRIYCFNHCSREMTNNFCGMGALALSEDIQWISLSSMFYSLRQWGVEIEWPVECKTLAAHLRKKL
jgi:hypothetical protein